MVVIKKLFKSVRVWVLIIFLIFALISIHPNPWNSGVTIRNIEKNSPAEIAGMTAPKPTSSLMSREKIIEINNIKIKNEADYYKILSSVDYNVTIQLRTNKGVYSIYTKPQCKEVPTGETELRNITEKMFNETTNTTYNITTTKLINITKTICNYEKPVDIGISVFNAPKTNLKKGLDLQGGTRVLLQPERDINDEETDIIVTNLKQRINTYGLSDIIIRPVSDFEGNKYIVVEVAGANQEEVKELISKQGKFEAKIGNDTVFRGGQDITYVCRSSECAFAINPRRGCGQSSSGLYYCSFTFSITLSPEAAKRQAALTSDLSVVTEGGEDYLSKNLDLYLDDELVDTLRIGADLKGRPVTDIAISGSGSGKTREEAAIESAKAMKRMQTILITGSLPVKMNVVRTDTISPMLGAEFSKSIVLIGILSAIAVSLIVFIRYKRKEIIFPIIITMISEIVIILGIASLIGWNIDMAAVAGIIAAIGTGVDDQIVITDETLRGEKTEMDWKRRWKRAFFIILAAYVTTCAAMIPLWFAGAGLLRGLALTTILGVSVGVLITRPAFGAMIETLLKK